MRKLLLLGFVLCVGLLVVACATKALAASGGEFVRNGVPENVNFGFSKFAVLDPWHLRQVKTVLDEAAARGYRVTMTDAQGSTEKQISDIEDLIAQNVDFLIIAPGTEEGFDVVYGKAAEKNIPIMQIDRETTTVYGKDYITTVVSNHYQQGYDCGRWLGENTQDREKVRVIEVQGLPGGSDVALRANGFRDGIADYPQIEIVASQPGNWSRNEAQRVVQNLVQSLGRDGFDCIYSHNDEMGLGTIAALRAAGVTLGVEAFQAGAGSIELTIDGQEEAVRSMMDGNINFMAACSPDYSTIFDMIEAWYNGEDLPAVDYTPDYHFTQETVHTEGLAHAYDYDG